MERIDPNPDAVDPEFPNLEQAASEGIEADPQETSDATDDDSVEADDAGFRG